jgi:hypothetical protein
MAKRYHESVKKMEHREYYAGEGARRTQEMQDGSMLREDRSAIANMPQNVMMKPYPKGGDYLPENLDDTILGVDRQVGMDDSKRRQHMHPKKV